MIPKTENHLFEEFQQLNEQTPDQITVQQLDQMVEKLKAARSRYEEVSKAKADANAVCENIENEIMGTLEKLGKKSYTAEGIAMVTKCTKLVYNVPKTNEAKERLYAYIESKYGHEALTTMLSINSQRLTSWANEEATSTGVGQIPGLEAPTSVEFLQFRSKS